MNSKRFDQWPQALLRSRMAELARLECAALKGLDAPDEYRAPFDKAASEKRQAAVLAALAQGRATVDEITARSSGLTKVHVAGALKSLSGKGMVVPDRPHSKSGQRVWEAAQ